MPIVTAYQCARTKSLFLEKKAYIAHLRRLVLQDRIAKLAQQKCEPLRLSLVQLQQTARNANDISDWLVRNGQFLLTAWSALSSDLVSAKMKGISNAYIQGYNHKTTKANTLPTLDAYAKACYLAVSGNAFLNLSDLFRNIDPTFGDRPVLGNTRSDRNKEYRLILSAQTWAFVAADILQSWTCDMAALCSGNDDPHRAVMTTLLVLHFPGCTTTQLQVGVTAGLLPDTREEFIDWLFTQRAAPVITKDVVQLPASLTTDSLTP